MILLEFENYGVIQVCLVKSLLDKVYKVNTTLDFEEHFALQQMEL